MAIKTDGTLWSWGSNGHGRLGQNNGTNYSSPVQIGSDTTWNIVVADNSSATSAAIKTDGTLWVWGLNYYGSLGLNQADLTRYSSPVQLPGTTWSNIAAGGYSFKALKTDGTTWAWGQNGYGNLGVGDRTQRSSPTQIPGTSYTMTDLIQSVGDLVPLFKQA